MPCLLTWLRLIERLTRRKGIYFLRMAIKVMVSWLTNSHHGNCHGNLEKKWTSATPTITCLTCDAIRTHRTIAAEPHAVLSWSKTDSRDRRGQNVPWHWCVDLFSSAPPWSSKDSPDQRRRKSSRSMPTGLKTTVVHKAEFMKSGVKEEGSSEPIALTHILAMHQICSPPLA